MPISPFGKDLTRSMGRGTRRSRTWAVIVQATAAVGIATLVRS